MSCAEEVAHVETAHKFTQWQGPKRWRDWLILFDMELGVYFGWPVAV